MKDHSVDRIRDIISSFDPKRYRITISDPDASSVLSALKPRARSNLVQVAVMTFLRTNHPEPAPIQETPEQKPPEKPAKKSTRSKKKPQSENMGSLLQSSLGDL